MSYPGPEGQNVVTDSRSLQIARFLRGGVGE